MDKLASDLVECFKLHFWGENCSAG
jgi:hypothetical protein